MRLAVEDNLIISYEYCPPSGPTLIVARKDEYDMTILKRLQGDAAFGIYHYLIGNGELVASKDIPKKPVGDLHSVPHYRCPKCKSAVVIYADGNKYPCCQWCGQALDWE